MSAINAVDVTRDMLAYTLATDKESLKRLLTRNGIVVPENATNKQLISAILIAQGKSSVFKSELTSLLSSKIDEVNSQYSNFAGGQFDIGTEADKTMFTGSDDFFGADGERTRRKKRDTQKTDTSSEASKDPKEKGKLWKWLGENVFTKENINAGINAGFTSLNNRIQTKKNALDEEASRIAERQDEEINRQSVRAGLSVGTIILIVAGVGLLGGIIYYMTKK